MIWLSCEVERVLTAPPLPLGDSDTVQVGETVIYVAGNPEKVDLGTFLCRDSLMLFRSRKATILISGKILSRKCPCITMAASGGPVME